jgi:AmmeMemoRadiSam system protein B
LGKAIQSWDSDKRVAIVASGGLSHFVVDESLDRLALQGLQNRDETLLASIPENQMTSGTSEIKNWVAAAGALEHKTMTLLDYIPAYRTVAGTGCGMAFAWWE